jgi:hypothetical protein
MGAEPLSVSAFSEGPNCARASATIVVRDAGGAVLWVDAAASEHLFTLQDARNASDMRAALGAWISETANAFASTAALPPWEEGAEAPTSGEFPFYPESYIDHDYYESIRARAAPIYCYVQGMESMACLMLDDGRLEKIGVQSFPG